MDKRRRNLYLILIFGGACVFDILLIISAVVALHKGWLVLGTIYLIAAAYVSVWIYDFIKA
jgi:CHASE2 domain-containing sensor protein